MDEAKRLVQTFYSEGLAEGETGFCSDEQGRAQ